MPPKRQQPPTASEIEAKKQRNTEAQRRRRAAMSEQLLQKHRETDTVSHQRRREAMDVEQIQQLREANTVSHQRRREAMDVEQIQQLRETNVVGQRQRRNRMQHNQILQERNENAERQRVVRQHKKGRLNKFVRSCNTALLYENFAEDEIEESYLGAMSINCPFCYAKHFKNECSSNCCHKGTILLPDIKMHPYISNCMSGSDPNSKNFMENIRSYNSAMAFASMGAQVDEAVTRRSGPYCYRIHGQIYHATSALYPREGESPKFAQLYILDSAQALKARMSNPANSGCMTEVMENLQNLFCEINPLSKEYNNLRTFEKNEMLRANRDNRAPIEYSMTFLKESVVHNDVHPGRSKAPTARGEIAAVFHSADGAPPENRDITIHPKNGNLRNISILSRLCDPMCYPVLFPYGDSGWTTDLKKNKGQENVSQLQWYSYHFAIRVGKFNQFLNAGKLTHQFMVDAYCKTEANRLNWFRKNQNSIRAEDYDVLHRFVNNQNQDDVTRFPGKRIILPSTFQGSPRNMTQNYQDAMAIVRKYGKPDLFVTVTCNPKWREIKESLLAGQQPCDRPDLVARVFEMKLKLLLNDLTKFHRFGRVRAMLYVIEFQKRGLPHAHILMFMVPEDKAWENERINKIVCAEIPDKASHPRLHEIVETCMIHGPCGPLNPKSTCMENGKCSKEYPKAFCAETNSNVRGYPQYQRRDNGHFVERGGNKLDNRWVVPYNPYLTLKYNAHINVEICSSVQSVKYLFKYVYKGHDCANITFHTVNTEQETVVEWDEVKHYLETRYVSAPEACWRLREYKMHHQTHHVERLNVHLEDKQTICFIPGKEAEAVQQKATKSKLLAWFKLNQEDPNARDYLYIEIPEHYTWDDKNSKWKPRLRGHETTIGRMYSVSPTDREKWFLRILLLNVKGATSYTDLRKVERNSTPFASFQEACIARGLTDDDSEWDACLTEAAIHQMPVQLRQLFAFICLMCEPSDAAALFDRHSKSLMEDFQRQFPDGDRALFLTLKDIESVFLTHRKSLADFRLDLPADRYAEPVHPGKKFDPVTEGTLFEEKFRMLNSGQRKAFDIIRAAIENPDLPNRLFFIDGPGGSGKTFLYNTIMHYVRSKKELVLPCAFTGIAATLLEGGITSHSRFKLPIPINETSTCNVRHGTNTANELKKAKVIIWDEASMVPAHGVDAVDSLFKELLAENPHVPSRKPFGGAVFLFGGDFRQILPVVPHGSRTEIVSSCMKNSKCWNHIQVLKLDQNMRANDQNDLLQTRDFSEWLLKLGDGKLQEPGLEEDIFEVPPVCIENGCIVDAVFPGVIVPGDESIANRAILTPKNQESIELNEMILTRVQSELKCYQSIDSIQQDSTNAEEAANYPLEFLNSLTPGGMPPHRLNLKVGSVVMLLRNLDSTRGLCNGTRMVVKQLMSKVIDCEIMIGSFKGTRVFIPRVILSPSDSNLPFTLRRKQFPLRLAFAMTINKSQGQTMDTVGIYLPSPVFSHGQLYVAFSRSRSFQRIKVKVIGTKQQGNLKKDHRIYTKNVVYKEVFAN
ncbi:uncharacterized protein LOC131958244 [Physella acuta]|uniref:uncharacterized protein LOC131958244 n=1 Tax=Physella acuta TaxID=109671 RepID=UPI0027DB5231|nr:uncharacterized protein LOC131958244 [Physella acuta]